MSKELVHIEKVFTMTNGYPRSLVISALRKVKQQLDGMATPNTDVDGIIDSDENEDPKILMLKVPYAGDKGENLIKDLKNTLRRNLPENLECRVIQTGTKLSRHFNIKDKVDSKHLSNFIYLRDCKNKKCTKGDYIGETARRKVVRTGEHGGKDKKSWIFQHSTTTKHPRAKDEDFKVLATNYPDRRKRRLAEAMFIRDLKPSLNKQKESYKLSLFA